jgi:dynein heavy chain
MNSVFEYKSSMPFYELVVSTKETLCYQWFIENFILDLSPLFLTGITGSGKTILINSVLKKLQEGGILSAFNITFSS